MAVVFVGGLFLRLTLLIAHWVGFDGYDAATGCYDLGSLQASITVSRLLEESSFWLGIEAGRPIMHMHPRRLLINNNLAAVARTEQTISANGRLCPSSIH